MNAWTAIGKGLAALFAALLDALAKLPPPAPTSLAADAIKPSDAGGDKGGPGVTLGEIGNLARVLRGIDVAKLEAIFHEKTAKGMAEDALVVVADVAGVAALEGIPFAGDVSLAASAFAWLLQANISIRPADPTLPQEIGGYPHVNSGPTQRLRDRP